MNTIVLEKIKQEMKSMGIDYHYMYNKKETISYPYVTGEYSESGLESDIQKSYGDLLLECWNRGRDLDLNKVIEQIKERFDDFQTIYKNVGIAINFNSCVPRRTDDIKLKKYEIHLDVVYWKGK